MESILNVAVSPPIAVKMSLLNLGSLSGSVALTVSTTEPFLASSSTENVSSMMVGGSFTSRTFTIIIFLTVLGPPEIRLRSVTSTMSVIATSIFKVGFFSWSRTAHLSFFTVTIPVFLSIAKQPLGSLEISKCIVVSKRSQSNHLMVSTTVPIGEFSATPIVSVLNSGGSFKSRTLTGILMLL